MKIDFLKTLIAIGISGLLAYACYEICDFERVSKVITVGAFITILIPCLLSIGISAKEAKNSVMLKTLSWVVLVVEVASNITFAFFDFNIPVYIILNGILLLLYILIYNSIYRTHM